MCVCNTGARGRHGVIMYGYSHRYRISFDQWLHTSEFTEHPNIEEDISQQHSFGVFGFDVLMERFLKIFGLALRKMIEKSGPVGRYSHDVIAEQTCWRCISFMSKSVPRRTRQERVTQRTSSETRLTCRALFSRHTSEQRCNFRMRALCAFICSQWTAS